MDAEIVQEFDIRVADALLIIEVIYSNGGMASKSVVEDVLMNLHPGLDRHDAHEIMNYIEYMNLKPPDRRWIPKPAPAIEDYASAMEGVQIRWFKGNPLAKDCFA